MSTDAITSAGEDLGRLVDGLVSWADRLIPDHHRSLTLAQDLRRYEAEAGADTPLTRELLADVEQVCHRTARHLTFDWHSTPAPPDEGEAPGWPPVPDAEVTGRAGFVCEVVRRDGYGLLRLDGLDEVSQCRQFLDAAFALLHGGGGLILDLRANGGGAMSALTLVAEFVLGRDPELILSVQQRDTAPRQWWTSGILGTTHWPAAAPVAVLIGPGTYSSGEALAYVLQTRGRVRVFGQPTPGAADHVTPVRVTPHVVALIPEGTPIDAVSGTNWEGIGVQPDVEVAASDAPERAIEWLKST